MLKFDYATLPRDGAKSAFVGVSATEEGAPKIFFELDKLATHTMVAGATGSGKTVAAQVLVEEALKKGVAVIVFDPTAQWTGLLRPQKNEEMLSIYPKFGLNKNEARPFKGRIEVVRNPLQEFDLKQAMRPGSLTIFSLNHLKQTPGESSQSQQAGQAQEQAREQAKTLSSMDKILSYLKQTDFSSQGTASELEQFIANTVLQVFDANLEESRELRLLLVYDEVHRLLPKFGGAGSGFRQVERGVREFRKWGVGLLLVSQVLSDFVGEIKANIGTEMQMRTKYEGDLDRISLKFGDDALRAVVRAPIGVGMVQNSEYNKGIPFFTAFRPLLHSSVRLSDAEIAQYEEYDKKLKTFAKTIASSRESGVDVSDAEIELKLARDKLETGSFGVLDIYLESLGKKTQGLLQKTALA